MGQRLRTANWSAHPLGPPADWPRSLLGAVNVMLNSRQPGFVAWSEEGFCFCNDACVALLGPTRDSTEPGEPLLRTWGPLAPALEAMRQRVMLGGTGAELAGQRIHGADTLGSGQNGPVALSFRGHVLSDDADAIRGVFFECEIETAESGELKASEAALRESEQRFREVADNAPVLIWITDPEGRCTWCNQPWLDFTGRSLEQELGHGWMESMYGEDRLRCEKRCREAMDTRQEFEVEYRLRRRDGRYRWIIDHGVPRWIGSEFVGYIGCCIDIDDRKRAEQAFRENDARLRVAVEGAGMASWDWEIATDKLTWNREHFLIMGFDPDVYTEPTRSMWHSRVHPDDLTMVDAAVEKARVERTLFSTEYRIRRVDNNELRWIEPFGRFSYDEQGQATHFIGVFFDVTDRKNAEAASRENEAFLQSIIGASADCVKVLDLDGRLLWMSDNGQRILEVQDFAAIHHMDYAAFWRDKAEHLAARAAIRAAREGRVGRFRGGCPTLAGTQKWWDVMISPIAGPDGKPERLLSVSRDITETRRAEAALAESEERFRNMADHSPVMLWVTDAKGLCTYLNRGWYEYTGQTDATGLGFGWLEAVHPEDRGIAEEIFRDAVTHSQPFRVEYRLRRKDGVYRWAIDAAAPRFGRNGEYLGYVGSVIDIHDRRQYEQELRQREMELRLALASGRTGTWEVDAAAGTVTVSEETARVFGFGAAPTVRPLEDFIGRMHPDDVANVKEGLAALDRPGAEYSVEHRIVLPDGTERWVAVRGESVSDGLGGARRSRGAIVEITERKKTEQALRESQSRLSAVFQQAGAGIGLSDTTGRLTMVNDRYCEIVGRSREDLLRIRMQELTHPDDLENNVTLFQRAVQEGAGFVIEKRYLRPDGAAVWVRNSVAPIRDVHGRVESILAVTEDITERKRSAEAVRASEEQLRLVADNAPVFLAHCDREHRYKFVNLAYAARYGLQRDEIVGRHVSEVVGVEGYATFKHHMDATLAGKRTEFEQQIPYALLGPRWVHVVYDPERRADGEVVGLIAVIVDVTARKQAEKELERARDEALAASRAKDNFLAALSHELRTPLNPVLLLASDAVNNPALPAAVRADFETVRKNVELEARLIDDLLDLTRITRGKLLLDRKHVDVHAILRDAIETVRAELEAKRLRLDVALDAPDAQVTGDPVRLQQVFWNVLKNAVKFTREGGSVGVRTQVLEALRCVRIEIVDTGIGLTPAELGRVFSAFSQGDHALGGAAHQFGGLGLGLAITRSIVELHAGRISATSAGRNAGATFAIELPLRAAGASGTKGLAATGPADDASAPAGGATRRSSGGTTPPIPSQKTGPSRVLVVEDHAPTRSALKHLLTRRGFDVALAGSVAEARERAAAGEFDLLISDIGLPDGDGCALLQELRRTRPDLPGIALSGYGMDGDVARTRKAGFAEHLTKPVNAAALDQAIAALIAR
jgi:PAS domain S-box-containing protein